MAFSFQYPPANDKEWNKYDSIPIDKKNELAEAMKPIIARIRANDPSSTLWEAEDLQIRKDMAKIQNRIIGRPIPDHLL